MTLKDRVEQVFPEWQRWYPSLFDAAVDLGILRARVCDPSSLLLSNRHASVRAGVGARWGVRRPTGHAWGGPAAELEHRRRWSAEENEPEE